MGKASHSFRCGSTCAVIITFEKRESVIGQPSHVDRLLSLSLPRFDVHQAKGSILAAEGRRHHTTQLGYAFTNLPAGYTYYFSVTSIDPAGNESAFSAEVSKAIP